MPKVGGKHFKYDKTGMAEAKNYSKMSGQPMEMTASKRKSMTKMGKPGKGKK